MATTQIYRVSDSPRLPKSVDIPNEREYEKEENANLDRKLCSSIRAAIDADNNYLANLLGFELGSHYYDTR